MATHSSTLAWKIPWIEEHGRLQFMGSQRVGHNWTTSFSLFTFMHWRRKWRPTPVFFLENPRDGGAWWAAVHGVAQSRTRLKRLSSSSKTILYSIFFPFFRSISFFKGEGKKSYRDWLNWFHDSLVHLNMKSSPIKTWLCFQGDLF